MTGQVEGTGQTPQTDTQNTADEEVLAEQFQAAIAGATTSAMSQAKGLMSEALSEAKEE
ncbi:hypothetical protein HW532_09830 [Kaustia mangrovi]|uniref:Uncharacterized protein n=1 Tax=Kaustia mangrovi TaxID=2593653 RepID=A0A7S8HBW5_9HYPH|nr:hypothetical protein [Kaustia mangrovi]QPC42961.1 hypothetical protein HW532_09830 [Kaustia mangrovi]